jgi:hypothetical protein
MRKNNESGADDGGYEVGYRKPPLHSRFRPGQSGNPAGRRKGVRNLATDVRRTLAAPVTVKEGDLRRKKSTQEGMLLKLREKALGGDPSSMKVLVELAKLFNNDATESGLSQLLADDQAILDGFLAKYRIAATITAPARSSDGGASKAGESPIKKGRK